MQDKQYPSGESGNVMFLILIAVVLFAALSFAVSMSNRGSGDASADNTRVTAGQIIQSGIDLESAMMRLRISKALPDSDISFENDNLTGYQNPACTVNDCKIFAPEGGQISYPKPNPDWLNRNFSAQANFGDWLYTGTACVPGQGTGNDATCAANPGQLDLVAILPFISREICIEINQKLGVPLDNGQPPKLAGAAWASSAEKYIGTYDNGQAIIDSGNRLFGFAEGCFEGSGTPPAASYHYYRVILPR